MHEDFRLVHAYTEPPAIETRFPGLDYDNYHRDLFQCRCCGHFMSVHAMGGDRFYEGAYAEAKYSGDKMRRTFERIMSLPPEQSDNFFRVKRICDFAQHYWGRTISRGSILDVGSGLAVFSHAMQNAGWRTTALDPDPRAVRHAVDVAGVNAVCGDFTTMKIEKRFDLMTFNKVLEHVISPVDLLCRSKAFLQPDALVYVELPDGEMAITAEEGPERQEFVIEHKHAFSAASMALLAHRAGFVLERLDRIHEPSDKYSLYMFLRPDCGAAD